MTGPVVPGVTEIYEESVVKHKCSFEYTCVRKDDCFIDIGLLGDMQPTIINGTAVIAFVDTAWLAEHASNAIGEPVPDKCLVKQSEWRGRYQAGARFDFPQISSLAKHTVQFYQGRNRSLIAHEMGIKTIPVMIPAFCLDNIHEHISDDQGYQRFDLTEVKSKFPDITVYIKKNGALHKV